MCVTQYHTLIDSLHTYEFPVNKSGVIRLHELYLITIHVLVFLHINT